MSIPSVFKYWMCYLYGEYKRRYTLLDGLPEVHPRVKLVYKEFIPH